VNFTPGAVKVLRLEPNFIGEMRTYGKPGGLMTLLSPLKGRQLALNKLREK